MRPIVLACIAVIWTSTETPVNGAEPPPIDSVENVIIRQFEVYATVENAGSPIGTTMAPSRIPGPPKFLPRIKRDFMDSTSLR